MHPFHALSPPASHGAAGVMPAEATSVGRIGRVDWAFGLAACSWAALLALAVWQEHAEKTSNLTTVVLIQLCLLAAERFSLLVSGCWRGWGRMVWVAHCVALVAWATWLPLSGSGAAEKHVPLGLLGVNVAFVLALGIVMGLRAWRSGALRAWAALLVAVPLLLILLGELRQAAAAPPGVPSALLPVVGLQLGLLWLAVRRAAHWRAAAESPGDEAAGAASAQQSRLAQDLHDGVGSHLTSIIASLDNGTLEQRQTAASLQHCLLELKLLVDGADFDGSVLGHLANLRYRTQPLLDAAGITLRWDVQEAEALEQLPRHAAVQVLRIAQEALANEIRHSGARSVLVRCRLRGEAGREVLALDVLDDGQGMPRRPKAAAPSAGASRPGQGLRSMRTRAARLGGRLRVQSVRGQGTCVQLRLPLAAPEGASGF